MTPSFGSYIGGSFAVIGIVAAVGLGGYWLRRWIVPEFSGALARLADATIAVALLVVSLELLGTLSILRLGWIVLVCIGVGLLAACSAGAWRRASGREVAAPRVQTIALLIALGVASFTVAEWTFPSQLSLDAGMFGGDTTWYHMPFAARIAQEGSTVHLHFTDPLRLAAWFYPQSSELVHAAGDRPLQDRLALAADQPRLALDRAARRLVRRPPLQGGPGDAGRGGDRPRRRGDDRDPARRGAQRHHGPRLPDRLRRLPDQRPPATGAGRRARSQDAPERDAPLLDKGPLVLAGIAAGLAASVKLTFLVPVVAIALGVIVFSGRGRRLTTAWVLGLSAFVVGGYWYVRAAIKTGGNPIPQIGFGPLHLPRPDQMPLDPRPRFAVAALPDRADDLPEVVLPASSTTPSGRSGR